MFHCAPPEKKNMGNTYFKTISKHLLIPQLNTETSDTTWHHHVGVSKNRYSTPKWMVKIMENPIKMDDLGGKPPIFGNHHVGIMDVPRKSFSKFWAPFGLPLVTELCGRLGLLRKKPTRPGPRYRPEKPPPEWNLTPIFLTLWEPRNHGFNKKIKETSELKHLFCLTYLCSFDNIPFPPMTQVKLLFFATILLHQLFRHPGFFVSPTFFSTTKKDKKQSMNLGHFDYKSLTWIHSRDILENQPHAHLNFFGPFWAGVLY